MGEIHFSAACLPLKLLAKIAVYAPRLLKARFLGLMGLLFLLLVAQPYSTAYSQSSSSTPLQLKQDALVTLEQIIVTDSKLQRNIDKAIEDIGKSLSDKGRGLFLDGSRLRPPPAGEKAFQRERQAVNELRKGIKSKNTPEEIQIILQEVIEDLVEADRGIAELSVANAEWSIEKLGVAQLFVPRIADFHFSDSFP